MTHLSPISYFSTEMLKQKCKVASYSFCYVDMYVVIMLLLLKNINIPCSHFKFEIKIYVITFSLFYYVSNLDYIICAR